jgi:DnaJ domain
VTDLIPVDDLDPYHVLGVSPSASIEEVEARYRLLLREHHPDLHQREGPEAVKSAEAATRNLNGAIAAIRDGLPYRDGGRARGGAADSMRPDESGAEASPMTDWFGHPIDHRPYEPVPCPFCGRPYDRLDDFELHLVRRHRYRNTPARAPRRAGRLMPAIGKLRFIPPWPLPLIGFALWAMLGYRFFVMTLLFLVLVLWTQTSSRFRRP